MRLINKVTENSYSEGVLSEPTKSKILERAVFTGHLFPNVVLLLSTSVDRPLTYVSENSGKLLGLSVEYLKSISSPGFTKFIHHEDIKGFKGCLEYALKKNIDLRQSYRVIFYYRIINNKGETIYLEDERMSIQHENDPCIHIALLKNITYDQSFRGVKMKIYKRIRDKYLLLREFFPDPEPNELTSRQRDIVQSVMLGLSNQEIADRLNLSVHTIKNHKRSLFRKFGIGTSLELISLVRGITKTSLSELFNEEFLAKPFIGN
jgi:DNA-binding CsgD family transcriptional regulator